MDPNQPPTNVTETNTTTVSFSPKKLSPIPFLLGVLLFLAPFIDIRCNNLSLQQVSGLNLATGFEIKTSNSNSLFDNLKTKDDDFSFKNMGKRGGNTYALVALAIGIIGLVTSLMKFKSKEITGVITGIGAAAALIGLMVDIKSQIKLDLSARTDFADVSLVVEFTPWFYFAIAAFVIGAFMSFKAMSGRVTTAT